MSCNSKNVEAVRNFLKVRANNFVKVVRIGEVLSRRRPPILTFSRLTYLACIALRTGVFLSSQGSIKSRHNAHSIKLLQNPKYPAVGNGWCHKQQKIIKLLVKFKTVARVIHLKKKKLFEYFFIRIICRTSILKFRKSLNTKDSSELFHV